MYTPTLAHSASEAMNMCTPNTGCLSGSRSFAPTEERSRVWGARARDRAVSCDVTRPRCRDGRRATGRDRARDDPCPGLAPGPAVEKERERDERRALAWLESIESARLSLQNLSSVESSLFLTLTALPYTQISVYRIFTPQNRYMIGPASAKLPCKKCRIFCAVPIHFA